MLIERTAKTMRGVRDARRRAANRADHLTEAHLTVTQPETVGRGATMPEWTVSAPAPVPRS